MILLMVLLGIAGFFTLSFLLLLILLRHQDMRPTPRDVTILTLTSYATPFCKKKTIKRFMLKTWHHLKQERRNRKLTTEKLLKLQDLITKETDHGCERKKRV